MSDKCDDNDTELSNGGTKCPSDDRSSHKIAKVKLKKVKDIQTLTPAEIQNYVDQLHNELKKKDMKIKKYKHKLKKMIKQLKKWEQNSKPATIAKSTVAEKTTVTETTTVIGTTAAEVECEPEDLEAASTAAAFSFVDEMRQVAEQAQRKSNFIYEPTSGLYYDQKTGYYYNAEYGLYYDGNTGCYYSYNKEKNTYEFHSQVQVQATAQSKENDADNDADDDDDVEFDEWGGVITDKEKLHKIKDEKQKLQKEKQEQRKKRNKKDKKEKKEKKQKKHIKKEKRHKRRRTNDSDDNKNSDDSAKLWRCQRKQDDFEDGELSSSSSVSSSESENERKTNDVKNIDAPLFKSCGRFQDIAKKYPPPLRIIVLETNLDELKVGSLSLITFKGGTLGREGSHDVVIPDANVSKCHLRFNYDTKIGVYKCVDLGSRNGTILNGARMSAEKIESKPHDLVHGSVLAISQTKLLCHVHEGNSTCGGCEPGLLIETTTNAASTAATIHLSHKEQLKKIQKKYGLENEKFVEGKQGDVNYNDRAATRRIKIGSTNDNEKTEIASVHTEISSQNKGFKMLSKLGWSKGTTLGKTTAGLLEPINMTSNTGTKGLGCDDPTAGRILTATDKKKIDTWKKAQARYQKTDIFCNSDDSN